MQINPLIIIQCFLDVNKKLILALFFRWMASAACWRTDVHRMSRDEASSSHRHTRRVISGTAIQRNYFATLKNNKFEQIDVPQKHLLLKSLSYTPHKGSRTAHVKYTSSTSFKTGRMCPIPSLINHNFIMDSRSSILLMLPDQIDRSSIFNVHRETKIKFEPQINN